VVPASAEGWKYPPFSGTIADGAVWGRGAMDTKCSLLGFFQAAEELLAEGFEPDCDIYLASSCTEEIGGSGAPKIVDWLKEHGVRLGMVLDEGGGVIDNAAGLPGTHSMIALGERGQADIRFIARSAGGHASTPPKNTPLVRLGRFMADCEKHNPFRRELSATVRATFETAAETCPFWMKHTKLIPRPLSSTPCPTTFSLPARTPSTSSI
jgi:carboxypeptidase PM20D1